MKLRLLADLAFAGAACVAVLAVLWLCWLVAYGAG